MIEMVSKLGQTYGTVMYEGNDKHVHYEPRLSPWTRELAEVLYLVLSIILDTDT